MQTAIGNLCTCVSKREFDSRSTALTGRTVTDVRRYNTSPDPIALHDSMKTTRA
jgi:hypothetical protein